MLNPAVIAESWPYLANGIVVTARLAAILLPLAFLLGLLIGILGASRWRPVRYAVFLYIDFFRAMPPLVLIIFVFYGLPFLGVRLGETAAFTLAMMVNGSSYFAEIVRAGIGTVPRGQYEAGRSTGMGPAATMLHIVLPQALRTVTPPLLGNCIELVKATSLASVVAIGELLRSARIAQGLTFDPTPLILAALIYLAFLWPCVRLLSLLERRQITRIA